MRGVCIDVLNRPPSEKTLSQLGATGYRAEIRAGFDYRKLTDLQSALLLGPSTTAGAVADINIVPDLVIIGNEPDGTGPSSWSMTVVEYLGLWNDVAPHIKYRWPRAKLSMAGLLGLDYLVNCWPAMDPKPDYVNKHYPDNEQQLQEFRRYTPVIVGEWCWRTAKAQEMIDWEAMLERNTEHSFWFCWSDGMVPSMGLVDKRSSKHAAYWRYQAALTRKER